MRCLCVAVQCDAYETNPALSPAAYFTVVVWPRDLISDISETSSDDIVSRFLYCRPIIRIALGIVLVILFRVVAL